MQLVIDIGNTSTKAALFDQHTLISRFSFATLGPAELQSLLSQPVSSCIFSSVVASDPQLIEQLNSKTRLHVLSAASRLPFNNLYQTPLTLGTDRIANIAGAVSLYPSSSCLVVDAGTCLKMDVVDAGANYLGGSISPGVSMRFRSMHEFTGKLPLAGTENANSDWIGNSTMTCLQTGVLTGMGLEMEGYIQLCKTRFEKLQVILTGGDAHLFEPALKNSIFASPDLTLTGLNKILILNDQTGS